MQTPHDRLSDPKIRRQPVELWKKVVPLALIFFLSSFNLTILQALKDAIVVTTSGAEALPFLAAFAVLPASVVFFAYYSKLLSVLPKHRVYYLAVAPFVVFYGVFATCIYPAADSLHLHGLFEKVRVIPGRMSVCNVEQPLLVIDRALPSCVGHVAFSAAAAACTCPSLCTWCCVRAQMHQQAALRMREGLRATTMWLQVSPHLPVGVHGLVKIVENWTFSLFFVFAELWGSVVISVLFWTLANDICSVSEAKTVYPMMGIAANFALVSAGFFMKLVSKTPASASTLSWLQTMVTTLCASSVAMVLVRCGRDVLLPGAVVPACAIVR